MCFDDNDLDDMAPSEVDQDRQMVVTAIEDLRKASYGGDFITADNLQAKIMGLWDQLYSDGLKLMDLNRDMLKTMHDITTRRTRTNRIMRWLLIGAMAINLASATWSIYGIYHRHAQTAKTAP